MRDILDDFLRLFRYNIKNIKEDSKMIKVNLMFQGDDSISQEALLKLKRLIKSNIFSNGSYIYFNKGADLSLLLIKERDLFHSTKTGDLDLLDEIESFNSSKDIIKKVTSKGFLEVEIFIKKKATYRLACL